MEILILSAGLGTRLQPFTNYYPKVLLPLYNNTTLQHNLKVLDNYFTTEIKVYLNLFYFSEQIRDTINKNDYKNLEIEFVYETELYGIGGSIINILQKIKESKILVINGDNVLSPKILKILNESYLDDKEPIDAALLVKPNNQGIVILDNKNNLIGVRGIFGDNGRKMNYYQYTGYQIICKTILEKIKINKKYPVYLFYDIYNKIYQDINFKGIILDNTIKTLSLGTFKEYYDFHFMVRPESLYYILSYSEDDVLIEDCYIYFEPKGMPMFQGRTLEQQLYNSAAVRSAITGNFGNKGVLGSLYIKNSVLIFPGYFTGVKIENSVVFRDKVVYSSERVD